MLKKGLSAVVIIIMILSIFAAIPVTVNAAVSGKCGKDANYSLSDDGVLAIYGTGEINNFSNPSSAPWYSFRQSISSVIIDDGITSIGKYSFYCYSTINNIRIPDSVTSLGDYAFYECTGLNDISLGKGMKKIGNYSFMRCRNLKSINIPNGVTSIGSYAYASCSNLTELVIPDSVTNIGLNAFQHCTSLCNIEMGNSVGVVSSYMFNDCPALTRLVIPDSVTTIGSHAFEDCIALKEIIISKNVNSIGIHAFDNCTTLTDIIIPNGVKSLGDYMFYNCTSLRRIMLSKNLTSIGYYAFYKCTKLNDVYYSGNELDWSGISISQYGNNDLVNASIHYNSSYSIETVFHTINSDYDNTRYFYFNENEEIEDLVFSKNSTEYNPRLAHFLACMARSAYSADLVYENYRELGFEPNNILPSEHYDTSDKIAGYNIGKRLLDNGESLVLITIRGSSGFFLTDPEWTQTDFNTELRKSELASSVGVHTGFEECEKVLYDSLKEFLGGTIQKQNTTYVITGHSLGGAVGNLLAMRLYNEGVSNQNVYDYNFACPLVGAGSEDTSVWNNNGIHNNIISVNNWFDLVPSKPTLGDYSPNQVLDYSYKGWRNFKRFGATYWFDNGFMNYMDAHNMCAYIDYLAKLNDKSHFRDTEYVINTVSVNCPVDVVIYDRSNNPIAGTTDNEPNYYNYETGEKAIILVNGDKKQFYIMNNEPFEVYLTGTNEGEMDYGVFTVDSTREETLTEKWYESVQLTTGKEMLGKAVNVRDNETKEITTEEKLFVVDNSSNIIAEITENGEEKSNPASFILGDADDNETIEAVDATLVQRKIADIETPYPDDVLQQGDADGSGDLELIDATAIQYYLANMKVPYLVGVDVYNSSQTSQHGKKELHYYANGGTSYGYDWTYSGGKGIVNVDCSYDYNARQYDFIITGVSEGTADITLYYSYDDVQQNRALMRVKVDSDLNVSTVDYEYQMNEDGTVTITDYIGVSENVVIPSKIDGYTVTTIGSYAFDRNRTITTVKIPNTVTKIKNKAFYICPNLKSADLPDSLDNYSAGSIYNCIGLERLNVSRTNPLYTSIDGVLYSKDVTGLVACPNAKTEIDLPDSLTYIQPAAFEYCANLKTVVLPETVRGTLSGVFRNCTALESVNIPEGVYKIEDCFKRCTSLKSINLPQSVKEIGISTFANCTALESITLPNAINRISSNTFEGCSNLTTVTFSNAVADIDSNAFARCTRLNRINFYGSENDWTTISVSDGNDVLKTVEVFYLTNPIKDYVKPYLSLTYNAMDTNRQNVKLTMTDNVAIKRYGVFRDAYSELEGGAIGYYEYYNTTAGYVNITIDKPGTYYFIVQDNSGNSSVERSLRFEKYLLDPNGGTVETDSVLACWDVCSLPVPVRNNYQFIGWSKEKPKNYTASASNSSANNPEEGNYGESTKLYANWMLYGTPEDTIKPTVSIDCSGQSSKVTLNMSDNTGILGYYWGGSSDYRKNIFVPGDKTSVTSYMLNPYANYLCAVDIYGNVSEPVSVYYGSATMDANGGFYGKKVSVGATMPLWRDFAAISVSGARGKETTPEEPIRNGYTFVGWAESPYALTGEKTIDLSEEGTYYAVWKKDNNNPRKVHYYADGGDSWGYDWESSGGEGIVKVNCYYSVSDRKYDFEIIGVSEGAVDIKLKYKENVYSDFIEVPLKVNVDGNLNVIQYH